MMCSGGVGAAGNVVGAGDLRSCGGVAAGVVGGAGMICSGGVGAAGYGGGAGDLCDDGVGVTTGDNFQVDIAGNANPLGAGDVRHAMGLCIMTRPGFERQVDILAVLHVTKAMGFEHHVEEVWQHGGVQEGLKDGNGIAILKVGGWGREIRDSLVYRFAPCARTGRVGWKERSSHHWR